MGEILMTNKKFTVERTVQILTTIKEKKPRIKHVTFGRWVGSIDYEYAMKGTEAAPKVNLAELPKSTCTILKAHNEMLKNDPERLTTGFLQKLIGVKC